MFTGFLVFWCELAVALAVVSVYGGVSGIVVVVLMVVSGKWVS